MSKSVLIAAATSADLVAQPISPDKIIEGKPETRSKELARSYDRTSYAMVWDCTAGRFTWDYNKDETLVVLTGEAFISVDNGGAERRIGPGDVVFFQAGSSAAWRVPKYIQKVAFLRHPMPRPVGFCVLAWNLFLRIVGVRRGSGL
jgi:uncharacterized cupin superfamily protein